MPRHARQLADSGIYHVMLRGVNRDAIFIEDDDPAMFLRALSQAKDASGCLVFAYCLMSNHVHLVLRSSDEPIGTVVKRLGVRYAGWFNRKYGRVGHFFQDRFKSVAVEDDAHLVTLLRYVWNNPVEAGIVERADEYRWSSCGLVGRSSPLIDEGELQKLLPSGRLSDLVPVSLPLPADERGRRGRPRRHTDAEAAALLYRACRASSPAAFLGLEPSERRQAIRELRTRAVAYDLIARVTGMSATSVRRLHADGNTLSAEERRAG
ncbi:MAG TPA: transposase [Propionicimonas sp.]|nr:transposase [Propionicimonas sp.]